jgi:large subunit ribosomal protein L22
MEVRAIAKHVRVSPRKVRRIVDVIRGKPVSEALATLSFMPSPTARAVAKVVKSASANAENNFNMNPDALRVIKISADPGRTLRRYKAKARGRMAPLLKRSTHITVVVEED